MSDTKKLCSSCKQDISVNASICSHCGNHQNRIIYWLLFIGNFGFVSTFISIGLLVISLYQWSEAKEERISAAQALATANEVKIKNEQIFDSIKRINVQTEQTSARMNLLAKFSLENSFILASESFLTMYNGGEAKGRLERNLDSISHLINTQPEQEKAFWKPLNDIYKYRTQ